MSNRPDLTPNPSPDPGKEALARARAARAVLREQEQIKEQRQQEAEARRRRLFKNTARRTCMIYAALNLIYFLVYIAVIYPIKEQPFPEMILGGTSITGHAVFFASSLLSAFVYSLVLYRRQERAPHPVIAYLAHSSIWFTAVMALCLASHGIYLDMLYNPYNVTQSAIFLGPSFLLTFAVLLFSLGLAFVNRIYQSERLPLAIRAILHLLCVILLIVFCIQLIAHGFASSSDLLIFLAVFAVLYAFVCIFVFSAKGSIRREENEAEEYVSMFKKAPEKPADSEQTK